MTSEQDEPDFLGIGIYTVREASRLTKVPAARIRRWLKGYSFPVSGKQQKSPPVVHAQLPLLDGALALGFLDLLEVRFVDAFRRAGVSWRVIRVAYERAKELVQHDHPYCTRRFRTDGRTILAEISHRTGEDVLLDLAKDQFAFKKVIAPYLYKGLEFAAEEPVRWWPMDRHRQVVIDPARAFGQPIVNREGVPTRVLAEAYKIEESFEVVARWFEVDKRSVRDAVEFEHRLAA